MAYQFFFSYARDDTDPYLEKFYNELVEEVRVRSGISKGQIHSVGFRDTRGIDHGAEWSSELVQALQTSRVFVSLCSPNYSKREWCGREWTFFRTRVEEYLKAQTEYCKARSVEPETEPPRLMLPVAWIPYTVGDPPPPAIAKIQAMHDDYGEKYANEGLRDLVMRHPEQYVTFRVELAKHIVRQAQTNAMPDWRVKTDIGKIANAFQPEPATPAVVQPLGRGPRFVQFVCVVGRPNELMPLGRSVAAYGEDGDIDWKPFLPPSKQLVIDLAMDAARLEGLVFDRLAFCENLVDQVRDAEQNNNIVIVLVDAWTLRLDSYCEVMTEYDKVRFRNAALLVPWNLDDPEAGVHANVLHDRLQAIFSRQIPATFRHSITSPEQLLRDIRDVLNFCRNNINQFLTVYRKPIGGGPGAMPLLNTTRDR